VSLKNTLFLLNKTVFHKTSFVHQKLTGITNTAALATPNKAFCDKFLLTLETIFCCGGLKTFPSNQSGFTYSPR
jgi:hypothetical protein